VTRGSRTHALAALAAALLALALVAIAAAEMRSTKLAPLLCETTGGGRIVRIPDFRGERIDRRLLTDIDYLQERFKIFITDGYSLDPVHSHNGEHPLGLALDIVPDFKHGGTWRRITRLAEWAEPKQDQPRAPFRWVGYNGDPGHGRGNHLHLSYSHSPAKYDTRARKVWTLKCPGAKTAEPDGGGDGGTGTGGINLSREDIERTHSESGGISLRDSR
jgi:hypothetical protein